MDGKLDGTGADNVDIPVSGNKPSSGKLYYSNNILTDGCLVFADYAVTFNGNEATTSKGDCSNYTLSGNQQTTNPYSMAAMCPGCKFIYLKDTYAIVGSSAEAYFSSDMPTEDNGLTNDYTTLIGEGEHPYFLGLIESTSDSTKIGRAFVCGIENDTPFCLEGYDPSKYSDDDNVGILNTIFPECGASAASFDADCGGSSVYAYADDNGYVDVGDDDGGCDVFDDGHVICSE